MEKRPKTMYSGVTKYYNTSEACNLAGISRATFLRWVREGKIEDVSNRNANGWRRFTESDIDRLKSRVNEVYKAEEFSPGQDRT